LTKSEIKELAQNLGITKGDVEHLMDIQDNTPDQFEKYLKSYQAQQAEVIARRQH
jgi:hypothetical protein